MMDLGRSGVTDVSSLAVNAYLGLAKLCSRLYDEGAGGVSVMLRDSSLAVWKQILIFLTELMKTNPDKIRLVSTWVQGVFLLILEVEAKASEKVLECNFDCLFGVWRRTTTWVTT